MIKCPICGEWNKDYDSERIKCWNCDYKIITDDIDL